MKNKKLASPRPQGNNKYNSITAQKVFKALECSTALLQQVHCFFQPQQYNTPKTWPNHWDIHNLIHGWPVPVHMTVPNTHQEPVTNGSN